MSHSHAANTPRAFDEVDPHGQHLHGQHESHVIVGPFLLRSVLAVLLLFTVLTVGFAQAEIAIQNWLGFELPWWINVVGAMSIAVVKSLLVMAIFMQLKYDNPINTVAMLFCFFALGLFLLFTGLDLFTRGWIYEFKAPQVVAGGTGQGVATANGMPIADAARDRFKLLLSTPEVKEFLVIADAIQAGAAKVEAEGGAALAAAAPMNAMANHMFDLHSIMVHPPAPGEQARAAAELNELADRLRGSGNAAAADAAAKVSGQIKSMVLAEALASYSVEGQFAKLAAFAHGGAHHAPPIVSTANMSRARSGDSGALADKPGHGPHVGAHSQPAAGH